MDCAQVAGRASVRVAKRIHTFARYLVYSAARYLNAVEIELKVVIFSLARELESFFLMKSFKIIIFEKQPNTWQKSKW